MRFLDFRLAGFAQHDDTVVTFTDGSPQLIIGPNESGKSQLLAGLIGTIFGLSDVARVTPWHGEPTLRGELGFEAGGHRIQIVRHFGKTVEVVQDGTTIYTGRGLTSRHTVEDERYQQLLSGWLGFSDMDVFRGVVFIEQDLLADDQLSRRAAVIKRIISGSQEASYETAIKDLVGSLDKLKRRGRQRNDREIEQLELEIAELERRAEAAEEFEIEAVALEDAEHKATGELARIEQQHVDAVGLLDSLGRHRRLSEQLERQTETLKRASRDMRQVSETAAYRQELEKKAAELRVPGDPDADAIRDARLERNHTVIACQKLEGEIAEVEQELQRLRGNPLNATSRPVSSGPNRSFLVAAAVLALGSLVLGITVNPLALAGLLLAIALIALAWRVKTPPVSARQDAGQVQLTVAAQRRAGLSEELEKTRAHLAGVERRCDDWLAAASESSLDELIDRLDRYREVAVRLGELTGRNAVDVAQLQADHDDALNEVAITRRQIEQLEGEHPELLGLTPEEAARVQSTKLRLEEDQNRVNAELNGVRIRRGVLKSTAADDAASLHVVIREKREDLERKRRLAAALELAIATMESCVHDFQEHALDPVAVQAGQLIERITAGRYRDVLIDQETMAPSVETSGPGEIEVDALSHGARDQVYLAVRIALVDALSGGHTLPIILDDPCVHFDAERLEAAVRLLSEIARERQVIILTKDEMYTRWYQPVLRLQRHELDVPVHTARGLA